MTVSIPGGRLVRTLAALSLVAWPVAGCTQAQLNGGSSSSYLILTSLDAASGAAPSEFGHVLPSDVITNVRTTIGGEQVTVATIFDDIGRVALDLGLKDPGTGTAPTLPTTANFITVNRYRVEFFRADGRNTPGVDVPYGFDGAVTFTVGGSGAGATFTIVRNQAKSEAPLKALAGGGGAIAISAIARVTLFGRDQSGREVSVSGQISVNFADWGDPTS
ncbi:MAG TPA: hypothetical protein VMM93_10530 [Vicinamibacterales bacterium]|nr:hypothetical protein [Vicinamibacterales bacterium]